MFSTKTGLMIEECNNLANQMSGMREQIYELERVTSTLSALSCLDEPIARLKAQIEQMNQEYDILQQMVQGLNKISLYYIDCENRICSYGEQSTIHYKREEIGVTDYSAIAGLLNGLHLE